MAALLPLLLEGAKNKLQNIKGLYAQSQAGIKPSFGQFADSALGIDALGIGGLFGSSPGKRIGEREQKSGFEQTSAGFEQASAATMRNANQLAAEQSARMGQSLANRGLNDSPLAAGIINQNQTAIRQHALDTIAQARFGMEQNLANQEYTRQLAKEQMNNQLLASFGQAAGQMLITVLDNKDLMNDLNQHMPGFLQDLFQEQGTIGPDFYVA